MAVKTKDLWCTDKVSRKVIERRHNVAVASDELFDELVDLCESFLVTEDVQFADVAAVMGAVLTDLANKEMGIEPIR